MKRVILAAALAIAALSAYAQSSVTIYGVADAAYAYGSGDSVDGTKSFSGVQSGGWSGSRLGFKGQEDLGNGLKAVFTIEYGTNVDNGGSGGTNVDNGGSGLDSTRQSFVGFDSNYGAVTLGRQYAPSGIYMARNSAFEVTGATGMNQFAGSSKSGIAQIGGTMGTGDQSRWSNSIAYQSKDYSGFSGRVIYAFGESGTSTTPGATLPEANTSDNGRFGISGAYVNGPLNVDVIYQGTYGVTASYAPKDGLAYTTRGGDINEYYVGAGYDFKVVKVVGSYQQLNGSNDAYEGAKGQYTGVDADVWSIGAIYPVSSAGKIRAEYSDITFDRSNSGLADGSSSGWSLGYTHDLSKRTMLYTSYSYISNDSDSLMLGANGVGALGESNYTLVAGVKHSF